MSSPEPFPIKPCDIISNKKINYLVLDFNGEGGFGKVTKCLNLKTSEVTAIKILKDTEDEFIQREVRMLNVIRTLDPEKKNLVRFIDNFMFQDMSCLAFEMLDQSLWDLIIQRQEPLSPNEIRPITHQLLVAFEALKSIGIIHTDLKPDNVMLVNHQDEPFRVKLIDFGLALPASEVEEGRLMQALGYRAPEVDLGLPITEAVDMWGLGCVMAFLYFGRHLFPIQSTYHTMGALCHLLGQPGDHLLNAAQNASQYFRRIKSIKNPGWKFKTPKQYMKSTGVKPKHINWSFSSAISLEDAVESHYEVQDDVENVDRKGFIHLLKRLLDPDGETRITPEQALHHCFVGMHNLREDRDTSSYAKDAFGLMTVCRLDDSNESLDFHKDKQSTHSHINSSNYDEDDLQATVSSSAPFPIGKHDILSNGSSHYLVLDFNGEGSFGKVAKCVNIETSETTAVKIHKESDDEFIQKEVNMLKEHRTLDSEKKNLVPFIDNFTFQDTSCLTFEMLDQSLWDLIIQRQEPLSLNEIRPITHQLLVAFEALKSIGIIHTDLKPDNIMLVNHQDEPFRVKLIDLGLALPAYEAEEGMIMQALGYRAPEVDLALPITEAVDMWGLGCVMAFLYFGKDLFPIKSTYHAMGALCRLLGQPGDHLLNAAQNASQYFRRIKSIKNPGWKFKTPKQYMKSTGVKPKHINWTFSSAISLEDAVESHYEVQDDVENVDRKGFIHLLKSLLDPDGETRITPEQALHHCFVGMHNLREDRDTSSYAKEAFGLMTVCRLDDSNKSLDFHKDKQSTHSHINSSNYDEDDLQAATVSSSAPFPIGKHDILSNGSSHYLVLDFNGEGSFGKVAKCVNIETSETIAVKIHKENDDEFIQKEVNMLKEHRTLDSEKKNLVPFIDNVTFQDTSCLTFEMLDQSLWDLIIQRQEPLSPNEIRPITHQLLVAFEALKSIGIIHTDLKPDNVMLVNHQDEPFRVKLIDLGVALPAYEAEEGMIMQALGYRAPEVDLGLPITEAVDMWGLGCVMAFLYFGKDLFPIKSTYHAMGALCHLLGQPGDHLLNAAQNASQYFRRIKSIKNPGWKFKTTKQYMKSTGVKPKHINWTFSSAISLEDAVESHYEVQDDVENVDRKGFIHLLKSLLDPDGETRITPEQALHHCFVGMHNLREDRDTSSYAKEAFGLMTVCRLDDSNKSLDFHKDKQSTHSHINSSNYDEDDLQATVSSSAPFPIGKHDILSNGSSHYLVLDFNGEGSFGKVAKCVNIETSETIAVKIHKESDNEFIQKEVNMLKEHRTLDSEKKNLVPFIDNVTFQDTSCLTFEMLDQSLWDLIIQRQEPLSPNEIRPITHQLLVAFEALKSIGIIHTDLKPDNVMLVNHQDEPFRVKLIDLGVALPAYEAEEGMIMQALGYRAPEVDLGLPITEAVDMWGLGCVMAFLYFGKDLFPIKSTYHAMGALCHLLGQPGDHLLNAAQNASQYFRRVKSMKNPGWKFKTPKQYMKSTGVKPKHINWTFSSAISLEDAVESHYEVQDDVENVDRKGFIHLLKSLLDPDGETRITPEQALHHCFVGMHNLREDRDTSSYAKEAFGLMTVCRLDDSNKSLDFHKDKQSTHSHINSSNYDEDDLQSATMSSSAPFPIGKHDILSNGSSHYLVLDFNGEGSFGKVAKCVNIETSETIAVKIHKENDDEYIQKEVNMLKELRTLDSEKKNLVRFIDNFTFQDTSCLAFEMLDRSLWDLIIQRQEPLSPNEIRPITHQLLVAFEALKSIGIIHTDLKPDNVMLVNHQDEPFRVKLIDFGLALPASEAEEGMIMQVLGYRAPEVDLGLPITDAVDMWGLGCVMAFLYFGRHLFPIQSTYHAMGALCQLLGQPGDHLLNAAQNASQYFRRIKSMKNPGWKFKTAKQYMKSTGVKPKHINWSFSSAISLEDAVESHYEVHDDVENVDRKRYIHLLKQLLNPDGGTRITPKQALHHCFVTMQHLDEDTDSNSYAKAAFDLMSVCPPADSNEPLNFLGDIQPTSSHIRSSWSEDDDDHQACNDDQWKDMTAKMSPPEPIANETYGDRASTVADSSEDFKESVTSTHEESGAASTSDSDDYDDLDDSDAAGLQIDDRASTAADSPEDVRESVTSTHEESGAASTSDSDDLDDSDDSDAAGLQIDDRASAAAGSSDGAPADDGADSADRAAITADPNDGLSAATAPGLPDRDDVNTGRCRAGRRVVKFFSRMKKGVISLFRRRGG